MRDQLAVLTIPPGASLCATTTIRERQHQAQGGRNASRQEG